jgi:hypothetical protein
MSAFIETLVRLKERAEREWESQDKDTIPNPLAGLMGPQELHYNPAREVPFIGGLINRTVNAPLHGAGVVQEAGGEAAKALFGTATLLAAAGQRYTGDAPWVADNPELDRDAARILAEGFSHPGRALDAARTSEDDFTAYLAGVGELVSNPLNYTNGIGALGQGLAASGKAPAIGKALQAVAGVGEASNRASLLPLAALPRARAALTELPEFLRPLAAIVEAESRPALLAAQAAVPENAATVEALGNKLDARGTLRATLDDTPDEDMVTMWLARDAATAPQGEPGAIARADWLRSALLDNLSAKAGTKYPTLSAVRERPTQGALPAALGGPTPAPAPEPATPAFIRQLTGATEPTAPAIEAVSDTPAYRSDLDRMDALTGRDSVLNIRNLMQANYGTDVPRILRNLTGHASLSDEGRLVNSAGEDQTRSLLEYLLRRMDLTPEERKAFQVATFPDKPRRGSVSVVDGQDAPLASPVAPGSIAATGAGISFLPTQAGVAASTAGAGGLAGALLADTEDEDHQDDLGGIVGGALGGAALGASLATPGGRRNLRFGKELLGEAAKAQGEAFSTGSGDLSWANFSGAWSSQTVQHVKNLLQEPLSSIPMLLNEGGSLRTVRDNAQAVKDLYIAGERDPSKLLPTRVTDRLGRWGMAGERVDLGTDAFKEQTGQLIKDLNPFVSALFGAAQSLASPVGAVPVAGVAFKAGLEALAPMRRVLHETLDGITKSAFRSAIWEVAADDAAREAAQLFSASVQKRTGRALALPGDGYFSPTDVRSALAGVPSGTREALVQEWGRLTIAAKKVGEQAAKDAFGDFSKFDPATATTGRKIAHGAEQGLRKVVPFSSWYLRAMPIAAKIAADHPAYTLALLGVLVDSAKDTKEQGLPSYLGGKLPFDADTPVVGKLADVLTPGEGGATGFANVVGAALPLRTESLGADGGEENDTPYQTVERWAERAGFGFNPLVKAIMYMTNQDWQRPTCAGRLLHPQSGPGTLAPRLLENQPGWSKRPAQGC